MEAATKGRRNLLILLAIFAILLPLAIGILAYSAEVRIPDEPVDILIVKMVYPPELGRYISSNWHSSSEGSDWVERLSDFFRIEWLVDKREVRIGLANRTVEALKVDELKEKARTFNLSVNGLPVNVTVAMHDVPYLMYTSGSEIPDLVKRDALILLENQSFIRWLRGEGFWYVVGSWSALSSGWPQEFNKIAGVAIELRVENVKFLYHLFFNEPYVPIANASIPPELEESPYERENFGVYFSYIYVSSDRKNSGCSEYTTLPPKYQNVSVYEDPSGAKRLTFDVTSETGQKVMRILRDNRITDRLMESSQCEVRQIVRWVSQDQEMPAMAIVELVCEEKHYQLSVRIDLNTQVIQEIYFYPFVSCLPGG